MSIKNLMDQYYVMNEAAIANVRSRISIRKQLGLCIYCPRQAEAGSIRCTPCGNEWRKILAKGKKEAGARAAADPRRK